MNLPNVPTRQAEHLDWESIVFPKYAPLRLVDFAFDNRAQDISDRQGQTLRECFKLYTKVYVYGTPGVGKTTLARWLVIGSTEGSHPKFPDAESLVENPYRPLFLTGQSLAKAGTFKNVDDLIRLALEKSLVPTKYMSHFLETTLRQLHNESLLLIIDGLENARDVCSLSSLIKTIHSPKANRLRVMITSRPEEHVNMHDLLPHRNDGYGTFQIQGLSEQAMTDFVTQHENASNQEPGSERTNAFGIFHELLDDEELRDIVSRPSCLAGILLSMNLGGIDGTEGEKTTKTGSYREHRKRILDAALESHWGFRALHYPLSLEEVYPQLRIVADRCIRSREQTATRNEIVKTLQEYREKQDHFRFVWRTPNEFVDTMLDIGLLERVQASEIRAKEVQLRLPVYVYPIIFQ